MGVETWYTSYGIWTNCYDVLCCIVSSQILTLRTIHAVTDLKVSEYGGYQRPPNWTKRESLCRICRPRKVHILELPIKCSKYDKEGHVTVHTKRNTIYVLMISIFITSDDKKYKWSSFNFCRWLFHLDSLYFLWTWSKQPTADDNMGRQEYSGVNYHRWIKHGWNRTRG